MNFLVDLNSSSCASSRVNAADEYVCWSRMQAEAGQQLDAIIGRKEMERRAGRGLFFWGVGNPPAVIANVLARAELSVRAVFSIMKSRPKAVDVAPSRTFVWRRYLDARGGERPLPPHALITSRGDSAGGPKRAHYALMCHSDEPLSLRWGNAFDPSAYRNAGGTGAPVGASQVTALLKRVAEDGDLSDYEVNLQAWLTGSYWVRLTDPIELDQDRIRLLQTVADDGLARWLERVSFIRGMSSAAELVAKGPLL